MWKLLYMGIALVIQGPFLTKKRTAPESVPPWPSNPCFFGFPFVFFSFCVFLAFLWIFPLFLSGDFTTLFLTSVLKCFQAVRGFCENLRFPAVFCENLRRRNAVIPTKGENLQKSAIICEKLRIWLRLSLLVCPFYFPLIRALSRPYLLHIHSLWQRFWELLTEIMGNWFITTTGADASGVQHRWKPALVISFQANENNSGHLHPPY